MKLSIKLILPLFLFCTLSIAHAADKEYVITLKDHKYSPAELKIPAGQKVKVIVENQDSAPIEFESYGLNREKIVPPKGHVVVFIGPLDPGTYPYFDDFHPKLSTGVIKAE